MPPADYPAEPPPDAEPFAAPVEFSVRHSEHIPEAPEELTKPLGVGREGDEVKWRAAYAQRRSL